MHQSVKGIVALVLVLITAGATIIAGLLTGILSNPEITARIHLHHKQKAQEQPPKPQTVNSGDKVQ